MSREWRLIWTGLGIALLGAAGVMAYILFLSNLLVGFWAKSVVFFVVAVCLLTVFVRLLLPFCDILETRLEGDAVEGKGEVAESCEPGSGG